MNYRTTVDNSYIIQLNDDGSETHIPTGVSSELLSKFEEWKTQGNIPEPSPVVLDWSAFDAIYYTPTWQQLEDLSKIDIYFNTDFGLLVTNIQTQFNEEWLKSRLTKIKQYLLDNSIALNYADVNASLEGLGVDWTMEDL